ncbi:MAG TPA: hypothetical protein ENI49_03775 [Thermoplasmatales archaeon]|nr:hypothetical protein [Thermoplasmatales archaeon]
MKKMGILLITIMLFSMIGVFDFGEVKAITGWTDEFDSGISTPEGYSITKSYVSTSGGYLYATSTMGGSVQYTNSEIDDDYTVSAVFDIVDYQTSGPMLLQLYNNHGGAAITLQSVSGSTCNIYLSVVGGSNHTITGFAWEGTHTFGIICDTSDSKFHFYIDEEEAYTLGFGSDQGPYAKVFVHDEAGSKEIKCDSVYLSNDANSPYTKDFTSVEITSDKTHYDMTDTEAIFTVTVADENGDPCTGCTIDETITYPDTGTNTTLTWTDNGDGTYTSCAFILDQFGTYNYECTVSKEGYNDGSDSGVFTRDEGPYQIIVQTNKSRYTDADESVGTTVIVSDGNNNGVPGCTITGEITKYDGTTLASWSDWTNPTEGYYQHTVPIADLGVTGDNVECSFSAEVTIPDYDTVKTGSVSFTLNYDSGGGTGGLEISLSNTNIDYNTSSWSYSSTLTAEVTYDGSGVSGASVDVSTSPNGEGAAPLQVNPSSGETGDSGIFSASITSVSYTHLYF